MQVADVDRLICITERDATDDPGYTQLTASDVVWTLVRQSVSTRRSSTGTNEDTWTRDVVSLVVDALERERFVRKWVAVEVAE